MAARRASLLPDRTRASLRTIPAPSGASPPPTLMPKEDTPMRTLFQNGWLYDGTGAPARRGSLLIDGETIAAVDAPEGAQADLVLDCEGLAVAPGFIDSHSHNDWFACRRDPLPYFTPFLEQGIATQVAGNCGFSPFGWEADTPHRALIGSGLFSLPPDAPDMHDLPGFLSACGRPPVNLLPLCGHMSGRISLAGYDPRPLTAEELDRLDGLMASALEAGAGGISLGLMYEPDRYAPPEELRRAARMAQRYGRVLTVHARACSAACPTACAQRECLPSPPPTDLRAYAFRRPVLCSPRAWCSPRHGTPRS